MAGALDSIYRIEHACRLCGEARLEPILSFGPMPLADRLVAPEDFTETDLLVPLTLMFCPACSLVQIAETVDPEILFGASYPYFSSVSATLLEHARASAEKLIDQLKLGTDTLVVEIASNDGYMLRNFADRGIPVLGVEPAMAQASAAQAQGVSTLPVFFSSTVATALHRQYGPAQLIIANNVLAHAADLHGMVEGIAALLKADGVAVLEAPWVCDLVEHCAFDTIYHQHLCYFSVTAVNRLFERHGLTLNHVTWLPKIHGGSMRFFVSRQHEISARVALFLAAERDVGWLTAEPYLHFADRARSLRDALVALIEDCAKPNRRIAAYGAAAKGTTLLDYCGLDRSTIEYVVDRNPFKHGKFMPGSRLPIKPVEYLPEDQPDYTLLLSWNFKEEILEQQAEYRARGGRFIVPIPTPALV